jgi:hypothetical protein
MGKESRELYCSVAFGVRPRTTSKQLGSRIGSKSRGNTPFHTDALSETLCPSIVRGNRLVDESFLVEEESLDGHFTHNGSVVNADRIDS